MKCPHCYNDVGNDQPLLVRNLMIPVDKLLHLSAGFVIATCLMHFGAWSILGAVLAGAGKELYDLISKKGTPDYLDFIATVVGGLVSFGVTTWLR